MQHIVLVLHRALFLIVILKILLPTFIKRSPNPDYPKITLDTAPNTPNPKNPVNPPIKGPFQVLKLFEGLNKHIFMLHQLSKVKLLKKSYKI